MSVATQEPLFGVEDLPEPDLCNGQHYFTASRAHSGKIIWTCEYCTVSRASTS